ncbi:DUF3800 domain-containing protein [Dickeya dianthicola]|uniref:DUF3800 domain-containing protein n=1 Tax=Dickeya dianthicola TaxID=204039 RepID=UPI003016B1FC
MDYYLDESGSTGDLVSKKLSLDFSNQPIFSHACIGFDNKERCAFREYALSLKKEFLLEGELKSQDIYFEIPEFILKISEYMKVNRVAFFCEVMDKRYNIAVSIVTHQIIPANDSERDGKNQYIRNILADYLSRFGTQEVFENFMKLCLKPSEVNLLNSFDALRRFFLNKPSELPDDDFTILMIDETIDDYHITKKRFGVTQAISYFMPIPDFDNNNNVISLTPHVHCFYNIIGRLNKYHLRNIGDITLHHDIQNEFSSSLLFCFEKLKTMSLDEFHYTIPNADFVLTQQPDLLFEDSEDCIEIQACDLLAGFINRFINGVFYKKIDIDDIYLKIFNNVIYYNRFPMSPLGTNFVLPLSIQRELFNRFNL